MNQRIDLTKVSKDDVLQKGELIAAQQPVSEHLIVDLTKDGDPAKTPFNKKAGRVSVADQLLRTGSVPKKERIIVSGKGRKKSKRLVAEASVGDPKPSALAVLTNAPRAQKRTVVNAANQRQQQQAAEELARKLGMLHEGQTAVLKDGTLVIKGVNARQAAHARKRMQENKTDLVDGEANDMPRTAKAKQKGIRPDQLDFV